MPTIGYKVNGVDIGNKYITKEYALDRYGWLFTSKLNVPVATGYNTYGQLGDSSTSDRSSFVEVAGFKAFVEISGNRYSTIGADSGGNLFSWGRDSLYGLLGQGTASSSRSSPSAIFTSRNVARITSGVDSHHLIDSNSQIWSWGYNSSGQLGDGTTSIRSSPVQLTTTSSFNTKTWRSIAAGTNNVGAIDETGKLYCWGSNFYGQLGDGTTTDRSIPTEVSGSGTWKLFASSGSISLGVQSDGKLYAWGRNLNGGQYTLGVGSTNLDVTAPTSVLGMGTNWKQLAATGFVALALDTDGKIWTWGYDGNPIAGTGLASSVLTSPVTIIGGPAWRKISTAKYTQSSFGIKKDGTLWAWGVNYDALGTGTTAYFLGLGTGSTFYSSPTQVGSEYTWVNVSGGIYNAFAIREGQDW